MLLMVIVLLLSNVNEVVALPVQDDGIPRSQAIERLISNSKDELGKPYVWGAMGPNSYDCSGYTQAMYKSIGINLNRTSLNQSKNGVEVKKENLQVGDLVFFKTTAARIGHVGIYLGGEEFIHASSGGKKVIITDINSKFYKARYVTARRVIDGENVLDEIEVGGGSKDEKIFNTEENKSIKDSTTGTGIQYEQTDSGIVVNYKFYGVIKTLIKVLNFIIQILAYIMILMVTLLWAFYIMALSGMSIINELLIKFTKIDAYEDGSLGKVIGISLISLFIIALILTGVLIGILEKILVGIMRIVI